MNVAFNSQDVLHLSVAPGIRSWSIFVGIMSMGIGAAYYNPDEHLLMKVAYLIGCLILGLAFLDDWEDCVFSHTKGQVTMTRCNWLEKLTSRCASRNTLILDLGSILTVRVVHVKNKYSSGYQVALALRQGGCLPISETSSGIKSDQDAIGKIVRQFLNLDRIEAVYTFYNEEEDYEFPLQEVESLEGSRNFNFEEIKLEDEPEEELYNESDSSSSDDQLFEEF
ncbi:cytochrome b-245 chaperone 1-like [Oratosquilla oratoria]|uniref:cytochrome b-245 chaperone 1-like n=1 Tax=Oratosquilla oratoria TaxID=337810 RepID=UPI003F7620BF